MMPIFFLGMAVFCWNSVGLHEYLPSIGCWDDPGRAPTLLHIPQEPERRDLVGLCGDTQVHKESG